jgi:lysophospholipase L1-like esterase
MLGLALVLAGAALAGLGVRVALERPRPLNLAGMLLAPAGLVLALLGVGRWLAPGFLGGTSAGARAVLRIMPAGDSLTRGSFGAERDRGGYRGPLWAQLAGRRVELVGAARSGPFAIDRDHESWDGVTIDQLAVRLLADLPAQAPDLVLLLVGTNDVIEGASPDVIAGRLAALLDAGTKKVPRARWLVAALPAVRPGNAYRVRPESIAAANARLRAAVADRAARGQPVSFVDTQRVGRAATDFADDGLHLSERGYSTLAEVWLEALRPLL